MLLERAAQRRRAAKLYRFYRQRMNEAIPIPLYESNEAPQYGLGEGANGTIWVDTDWATGEYIAREITVNHLLPPERKMSVLLHELGHYYCHYSPQGRYVETDQQEIEAITFTCMGLISYGLGGLDEIQVWADWRATQGRYRDTREIVTRNFDRFWAEFGMRAKKAIE